METKVLKKSGALQEFDEWEVFCKEIERLPYFTKMFDINKFKKEGGVER